MGLREVVGVVARRQLICERGEGDDQVDGTPEGLAPRALDRPGICGGGEHVFGKLITASDGTGQNTCSYRRAQRIWLWNAEFAAQSCKANCAAGHRALLRTLLGTALVGRGGSGERAHR
jgi:hypothetical protein